MSQPIPAEVDLKLYKNNPKFQEQITEIQSRDDAFFLKWINFVREQQAKQMSTYLSSGYSYLEQEKQKFLNFENDLDNTMSSMNNLKYDLQDYNQDLIYKIDEKSGYVDTYTNTIKDLEGQVKYIDSEITDLKGKRTQLATNLTADEALSKYDKLTDPEIIKLAKIFDEIFFDNTKFEWAKFRQLAFGIAEKVVPPPPPPQQPQQGQATKQAEPPKQSDPQVQKIESNKQDDPQQPQKQGDPIKQVEPAQEIHQEIKQEPKQEQQPEKESQIQEKNKVDEQKDQQKKSSFLKNKLTRFKINELSGQQKSNIASYVQTIKDIPTLAQLQEWLQLIQQEILKSNELDKLNSKLSDQQLEFKQFKEQNNIDFNEKLQAFYEKEINDQEELYVFFRQAQDLLQQLDENFDKAKQFISEKQFKMQDILNDLEGGLYINDKIRAIKIEEPAPPQKQ